MTEEAPEPEVPEGEEADWLKQLRKDAAKAKTLEKENAQLKRTSAMDELGVPKTGPGKLFRDKWDGDPTDLDALRSAVREYDLIPDDGDPEALAQAAEAATSATTMAEVTDGARTPELTVDALLGETDDPAEIERIMHDAGLGVPAT